MRRRAIALLAVGVALSTTVAWLLWRDGAGGMRDVATAGSPRAPLDTAAIAPSNSRVRVEVLNGTDRSGLARRAVQQLRDYGYDVVDFGNARETPVSTLIEVSGANSALGERIARALGTGAVRTVREGLPYLDVRVTVGVDWQPAPQSLRP